MLKVNIAVLSVLFCVTFVAAAENEVEVQRVLVIDKSMKPAAAAAQPKYEYVRVKTPEGKPNPELMCDLCCKKETSMDYGSKSLEGKTVAYLCVHCGEMCFRENGKEVKYTEEADIKALKQIHVELKKSVDKTQKPSVQALQGAGR